MTKVEAQTFLNMVKRYLKHYKRRRERRAYYCEQCNAWHVTSLEEEEYVQERTIHPIEGWQNRPDLQERWEKLLAPTEG